MKVQYCFKLILKSKTLPSFLEEINPICLFYMFDSSYKENCFIERLFNADIFKMSPRVF